MKQMYLRALKVVFAVSAALATAPMVFAVNPDKIPSAEGDARIIDQAEYPCSDCFFGTSDHFYCMEVNKKIIIAHQHVPTVNFRDAEKNYLTKYHKTWTPWKPGSSVHVKYNDKYVWAAGQESKKDIRMEQKYTTDIFINNGPCRDAIKPSPERPRRK